MAIPFSGVVTPSSIVFTATSGKMINITNAHIAYDDIKFFIKKLQAALKDGDTATAEKIHKQVTLLAEPAKVISRASKGRVEVRGGVVYFENEAIHNAIADRILWGLKEGFDMDPYVRFLDNLMKNPSRRAVEELYGFIEKSQLGITEDGQIIAYKRVRNDYRDIHSGKFDNSVGTVLEMARNKVDDDKSKTCSYGFHFCSFTYLKHFGSNRNGHDRIMIVKVDPADVVSIPADYNDAKARTCKYVVIGEYEGDDKEDVLATRAVWSGGEDWAERIPESSKDWLNGDGDWEASDDDQEDDDQEDDDQEDDAEADWDSSDWESSYYDDEDTDEDEDDAETASDFKSITAFFSSDAYKKSRREGDKDKRIFFQSAAPNGSVENIWYHSGQDNARFDWNPRFEQWVKTEDKPAYGPLDDVFYRLASGSSIKEARYTYAQNGEFVKVSLDMSDGSDIAIFDHTALNQVEAAIAQSPGNPRIRMFLHQP